MDRLTRCSFPVLAGIVGLALWSGYLRATRPGSECGSTWLLCDAGIEVELVHLVVGSLAVLAVAALAVAVFRLCPRGHPARLGATSSLVFVLADAALGVGLGVIAFDSTCLTTARAGSAAIHLVNMFLLLGALSLVSYGLTSRSAPFRRRRPRRVDLALVIALLGALAVGITGVTSGDADTTGSGPQRGAGPARDEDPEASPLLARSRAAHPPLAVALGLLLLYLPRLAQDSLGRGVARSSGAALSFLVLIQMLVGTLNVALLAPLWVQLSHGALAALVWIALVVFALQVTTPPEEPR